MSKIISLIIVLLAVFRIEATVQPPSDLDIAIQKNPSLKEEFKCLDGMFTMKLGDKGCTVCQDKSPTKRVLLESKDANTFCFIESEPSCFTIPESARRQAAGGTLKVMVKPYNYPLMIHINSDASVAQGRSLEARYLLAFVREIKSSQDLKDFFIKGGSVRPDTRIMASFNAGVGLLRVTKFNRIIEKVKKDYQSVQNLSIDVSNNGSIIERDYEVKITGNASDVKNAVRSFYAEFSRDYENARSKRESPMIGATDIDWIYKGQDLIRIEPNHIVEVSAKPSAHRQISEMIMDNLRFPPGSYSIIHGEDLRNACSDLAKKNPKFKEIYEAALRPYKSKVRGTADTGDKEGTK